MKEKRANLILVFILSILIIIAIITVIANKNKIIRTSVINEKTSDIQNIDEEKEKEEIKKINEQEEKDKSMQSGEIFCKFGETIVYYQDTNKSIYICNTNETTGKKIATLQNSAEKMYFDGENIYYVPYYYQAKGIYKIDLQGNVKKIYNGASLQLWITESEIYFVNQIGYDDLNQNPQGTLCVMDKDGQDVKELAKNIKNYFFIQNEKIYYTTQDRKMYAINLDGSEPVNLVQGRKFVIASSDNYIVYVDYANQEANHILNTKTNEDIIVGYFGETIKSQGKTYLNTRKILEDGAIDTDYTLFEIDEDGNTTEIGNVNNLEETIKYIANEKLYASNQQEGTYIIDLENKNKENASNYNNCSFYIGGYGYKIENSEDEEIIIEKLEL